MFKRVFLIILDSVGLRASDDAASFGDEGASTLGHIYETTGIRLPNLESLGLGKLLGLNTKVNEKAAYAEMVPESAGKDTIAGHWEMMGINIEEPLPTYPNGFPADLINKFETKIGRGILGNRPASGTVIIKELGEEHLKTGKPIVYTSADSVMQIAAHEEIIPVNELYKMCEIARELLTGKHAVGRVIARPFIGENSNFTRTKNRKDYALSPPKATVLDKLLKENIGVYAIGKIEDIFAGKGISFSVHTADNNDGMKQILKVANEEMKQGFLFANLVDFDSKYGHRRDVKGYANALIEFDAWLPKFIKQLDNDDLLLITADHGNDPTYKGTDHTRENTPLLVYGVPIQQNMGRVHFADVGATIMKNFNLDPIKGEPLPIFKESM